MSRILVVDDDTDFVKASTKVLEKAGHEVTSAPNGEKALAAMRNTVPDLVLLDMVMAYILDGMDVRQAMMEDPKLRSVPVIMVSSVTAVRGGEDVVATDEDIPVTLWLSKPISPDSLLASIKQALA